MRRVFFALAALGAAVLVAVATGATGNLPGGTSIEATVTFPADHQLMPNAPFTARGTAAVGQGQAVANTTLIYIVDVSGSTSAGTGGTSCPRQNVYDLQANTTLDCELLAVRDLNAAAIHTGTIAKIGFIGFAGTNTDTLANITSAAALDLDANNGGPAATLVAPDFSNFTPNPFQVATALFPSGNNLDWVTQSAYYQSGFIPTPTGWPARGASDGFTLFTAHDIGTATNYYAALQTLRDLLTHVTTPRTQVVFLSDGFPTETVAGQPLANILSQLHPANTAVTIDTFAVVGGGGTCGSPAPSTFGSLAQIAAAYGKTCVGFNDPETATTAVPAVIASKLTVATLKVDGSAIPTTVAPGLPQTGPANVTLTSSSPLSLAVGDHTICADANGQDGGGTGATPVEECHTITIKAAPTVTITGDGPDGTVGATDEGTAFPLTASVGGATSTAWTSSGGTGTCSFGDASQPSTSVTCTDDGVYALTLTARDDVGQVTTATEHLLVNNVAPTAALTLSPSDPHPLADSVTASVAISDPGADTFTCVLDWGDGAPSTGTVTGNACTGSHIYAGGGSYTVSATVTDDNNGAGSDSQPIVIDAPPTADVQPANGTEGTPFPLVVVATDDHSTPIVEWSISGGSGGGTCSIANIHAASTTATCTDDGPYTATVFVSDQVNPAISATGTLNVANVAPSVTGVPLAGRVALNAPVTATYHFTDPGSNDTHTCSIAWGDGSSSTGAIDETAGTCVGTHSYGTAGSYAAVGTVSDDDHGSGDGTVSVEVDAPPTVTIGTGIAGIASTDEGTAFVLSAAAGDDHPGALALQWSAAPSGPAGTCVFGNPASANTTVTCNDNGTYTLTLTANDGINGPVSASLELHVANVAPTLSLTGSVSALTASVTGSVFDAGANDTQTCSFNWGDGNTTTGVAVAGSVCQSSHPYATGTHTATITVTATDDDGGTTQRTITLTLNRPPSCSTVTPSLTELWPPDHGLRLIVLGGATDPDADPLTYAITSVRQDESTNGLGDGDTAIDAFNAGPGAVRLRAERSGTGDGRVYTIAFTVSDGRGGSCAGTVHVTVPKSASKPAVLTPGPGFDSYH